MCEGNTGAVLVTEDEKIVGIFTERDYAREGEVKGRSARGNDRFRCHDQSNGPDQTGNHSGRVCRAMGKYHVRHLPVLEKDRVVGIVSIRRLAEELLAEQQGAIVKLESYILGTGYGE